MWRKALVVGVFVLIVGGSLAGSKATDAEILTRVGRTAADKVVGVLPDRSRVAGPLAKVSPAEWGGLDGRVRSRLRTDALLEVSDLTVTADGGTVRLAGRLDTSAQRDRAVQLAQTTAGVTKVEQELFVPEGK